MEGSGHAITPRRPLTSLSILGQSSLTCRPVVCLQSLGLRITLPFVVLSLVACATPAQRVDEIATRLGFSRGVVLGTEFLHVVYLQNVTTPANMLHVYLDGDGSPRINPTAVVAPDPTPRNPLMLHLMALDTAPRIYLGRPCYHGFATMPPCEPMLWTDARYSSKVVGSLTAALQRIIQEYGYREIAFFGHSGGGTLAMLLAERFENTRAIVTLAGNLDVAAWARLHGYSPLSASLDPAQRPPLRDKIIQRHYVGSIDTEIPAAIARQFATSRTSARVVELKGFDHACCWQDAWSRMLRDLVLE